MKVVEKWKWRIRWAGRWTTTRIAMTEEEIRREHPEATRVSGTSIEVELPETEAEVLTNQRPPNGTPARANREHHDAEPIAAGRRRPSAHGEGDVISV